VSERVVSSCYLSVKFILICVIQIHLILVPSPIAFSLLPTFAPSANQPTTLLTHSIQNNKPEILWTNGWCSTRHAPYTQFLYLVLLLICTSIIITLCLNCDQLSYADTQKEGSRRIMFPSCIYQRNREAQITYEVLATYLLTQMSIRTLSC
jgi:hypothetical protein